MCSPRGPETSELDADDGVVRVKQAHASHGRPSPQPARRVHDVGEEHGGENPIIGHFCLLPGEELGDLLGGRAPPRFNDFVECAPTRV